MGARCQCNFAPSITRTDQKKIGVAAMPDNDAGHTILDTTLWKVFNSPLAVAALSLLIGVPFLWEHSIAPSLQNASERHAISEEVTQRIIWSKVWQKTDLAKSLNILNGADSQYIVYPKYARRSLSSLLTELTSLGYEWRGESFSELIALARRASKDNLDALHELLDTEFAQSNDLSGNGTSIWTGLVKSTALNTIAGIFVIVLFLLAALSYRSTDDGLVASWPKVVIFLLVAVVLLGLALFWVYPAVFGESFWNLGVRLLVCIGLFGACYFLWDWICRIIFLAIDHIGRSRPAD
jgi:hypothetical protein